MPLTVLIPHKYIENTQLQSREVRPLCFKLPSDLKYQVSSIEITLKLYEVMDEHQGDITKAHRISEPIYHKYIEVSMREFR